MKKLLFVLLLFLFIPMGQGKVELAQERPFTVMSTYAEGTDRELKQQTIISEFNDAGEILKKQTIRQREIYALFEKNKKTRAVFLDIVKQAKDMKTIREIYIYQYNVPTQQIDKAYQMRYQQIGDSNFARITNYTSYSFS